jgi:dCTP deaminase
MSILTRNEIKEEVEKGTIRFDPPLQDRQWGDVCVDLRLGYKFTQLRPSKVEIPLAGGISGVSDTGLWREKTFKHKDEFDKRESFTIEPNEFILAQTLEHVWIPRNMIARVEGRSMYARVGLSMHQTAPWLQPGWHGQITLEIKNSGPLHIKLMPFDDMPCQVTFMWLSKPLPEDQGYGLRPTDSFQNQSRPLPPTTG